MNKEQHFSYWQMVWSQFKKHPIGVLALGVVALFSLTGLYAPLLASSQPLFVFYKGSLYFPLMNYLFFPGFFTKRLDIFFNLLMFTLPLATLSFYYGKQLRYPLVSTLACIQLGLFIFFAFGSGEDPASDISLNNQRQQLIQAHTEKNALLLGEEPDPYIYSWQFDLDTSNDYKKLNLVVRYWLRKKQDERFQKYAADYAGKEKLEWLASSIASKQAELLSSGLSREELPSRKQLEVLVLEESSSHQLEQRLRMPTLWQVDLKNDLKKIEEEQKRLSKLEPLLPQLKEQLPLLEANYRAALEKEDKNLIAEHERALAKAKNSLRQYNEAQWSLQYIQERRQWLETQVDELRWIVMPLIRSFHWEDDAGGEQDINQYVDWWELTRTNRKDLVAALIFGIRVSLVVGMSSVALALLIGVPIGALAGYFGGRFDIIVSRLLEIWESMPVLFMLLMVVAVTQTKSIFLVIAVVGIFGWTGFSRFIRGEFFKQRSLPYVEACHALGYSQSRIIFVHILPNAIPPLLTLLPFAIMGAITSEAGLSFLGLGEEGSCSWGVLMDEGRSAFPGESYLLWPPALMLTTLLVAIALVGDAMRDALDPKMRS